MRPLADAYDRSAGAWAAGPDRLYARVAAALVDACPRLSGRRVLDIGAGTGALTRAIDAAGGDVVATDLAIGMLAHRRAGRPPALVADAARLPFRAATFDAALAGCVVNHLRDPVAALREAARVTRPHGTVAASSFVAGWSHPAKHAVDTQAMRLGFHPPRWYRSLKEQDAPAAGDPSRLAAVACAAGWTHVRAVVETVDGGLGTPDQMVAWRLGMAHLAPFVANLDPDRRAWLVAAATEALGQQPPPVRPELILLVGLAPPSA